GLAIGAATEGGRALAMPAGTRARALQTRANSSGVAPASPQVAYRALLERCTGRPRARPKKVGRIFGPTQTARFGARGRRAAGRRRDAGPLRLVCDGQVQR